MPKPFTFLRLMTLILCSRLYWSMPLQKTLSLKTQLNPYYVKAMTAYRRLEGKLPREELQAITTIGILNGAKRTKQQMEKHLTSIIKDLLFNTNMNDNDFVMTKIEKIEKQLQRDQKALEILTKSLDMATNSKDAQMFQMEMLDILKTIKEPIKVNKTNTNSGANIGQRIEQLRKQILQQVDLMRTVLDDKINDTLDYIIDHAAAEGPVATASNKRPKKRQAGKEEPAYISQINHTQIEDDFRNNLVEVPQGDIEDDSVEDDNLLPAANNVHKVNNTTDAVSTITAVVNTSNTAAINNLSSAKQEEGSSELSDNDDEPSTGGGLVGIITSLSGGEGGSDIGALIGALTGVISQIFGPGGLDVESLISSATALISGLLAGDKNFGNVLGIYVGTTFDGLSGGGGAVNNGQFIGNFLGTVVASLSADPEEDDAPPKPLIFLKNLITSFLEAKNRPLADEESSERKDTNHGYNNGGSDSSLFVKHIVSHVVGSVVSLILNTSLGASGGASQASQSIFAGSSTSHKPAPAPFKG